MSKDQDAPNLLNFTHSEQDDELIPLLEKLNSNFLKYKGEIRSYFQHCFAKDGFSTKAAWTKNLPKDEINGLIEKLIPFIDSPSNIESFHKILVYSIGDFLA